MVVGCVSPSLSDIQMYHLEKLCLANAGCDPIQVTGKNSKYKGWIGVATRYTTCRAYVTLIDEDGDKLATFVSKRNMRKLNKKPSNYEEAVLDALPEIGGLINQLAELLACAGLHEAPIAEGLLRTGIANAANEKKKTQGPYFSIADPNAMATETANATAANATAANATANTATALVNPAPTAAAADQMTDADIAAL